MLDVYGPSYCVVTGNAAPMTALFSTQSTLEKHHYTLSTEQAIREKSQQLLFVITGTCTGRKPLI